jgi:Tol biopolymer transport system component
LAGGLAFLLGLGLALPALAHSTERVSIDSAGTQAVGFSFDPAISADGRYLAFDSVATNLVADDTNGAQDVFIHDQQTGATERISVDSAGTQANDTSFGPAISADDRYMAFASFATNLVADDTNGAQDVFVRDRGKP